MSARGGVFCIESFSADLRNGDTVEPILDYLEACDTARIIYRRIETPQELRHYLSRFEQSISYNVGFLAMHGSRGRVCVGNQEVNLDELTRYGRLGEPEPGQDEDPLNLAGKALYLGSCSSLHVAPPKLEAFRRDTHAALVCGYTKPVAWIDAGAVEIMLLDALARASTLKRRNYADAIRRLGGRCGDLFEAISFVSEPDWRA